MAKLIQATGLAGRLSLNKSEIAEAFGVSPPAVDGWVRRGCPVVQRGAPGVPWVFDVIQVATWRADRETRSSDVDPDQMTPTDRRAWFDSESKRRDLQVRDRELVPAAELEQAVATAMAAVSQELQSLADKIERRFALAPDVIEAIDQAVTLTLDAMADRIAVLAPPATSS